MNSLCDICSTKEQLYVYEILKPLYDQINKSWNFQMCVDLYIYIIEVLHKASTLRCDPPGGSLQMSRAMRKCVMSYAINKGADQPSHSRSLISAFVVRCLECTIFL